MRDLTLDSLRDAVGFVMQDPHLFHETIRENLRYARPDATDDELVAACKAARIHELIVASPTATTHSSASAATGCRAARSSASRSRACC